MAESQPRVTIWYPNQNLYHAGRLLEAELERNNIIIATGEINYDNRLLTHEDTTTVIAVGTEAPRAIRAVRNKIGRIALVVPEISVSFLTRRPAMLDRHPSAKERWTKAMIAGEIDVLVFDSEGTATIGPEFLYHATPDTPRVSEEKIIEVLEAPSTIEKIVFFAKSPVERYSSF